MPLYNCELCNYSTKFKADYKKHLNTKKHQGKINGQNGKISILGDMSTNEHKMSTNEHKRAQNEHKIFKYNCNYCESQFTTMANKRRHELHYCKNIDKKMDYQKL